jgi:hypothetical protein
MREAARVLARPDAAQAAATMIAQLIEERKQSVA